MALSTSDWITIIASAASVVSSALVSIGIATWQVKKATTPLKIGGQEMKVFTLSSSRWLAAQLWPFVASTFVSVVVLSQSLLANGPVTKSFVISLVLGSVLLVFSVLSVIWFIVAAAFRPAYLSLGNLALAPSQPAAAKQD